MTKLVVENIRLKELLLVVNKNKPFFDEFVKFLSDNGYNNIYHFVSEQDEHKIKRILNLYFDTPFTNTLFDGIARPYNESKSKWFFITWILRDAPQQRLQPIVNSQEGSVKEKRIWVIIKIMKYVHPLLPEPEQWEWPAVSEVMLQRLEGSRRALKGSLFEAIIRSQLIKLFKRNRIKLKVNPNEVKLKGETYDIEVFGQNKKILIPVKTRETMGGGHALLFTRDIHKSISVAQESGFDCIPVVIAESWAGNLNELPCENYIHISMNPNQVEKINPLLKAEFEKLIPVFSQIQ